jgi:branched-chain amino acid transport system permease protein
MNFFVVEVLIGGLLTGVLYSLVALGFVLIFKASGVFNFAQGAMCLFAALALVRLMEAMPTVLALIATAARCWRAFATNGCVAALVNQKASSCSWRRSASPFPDRAGQALFGSDVYALDSSRRPADPVRRIVPGGIRS